MIVFLITLLLIIFLPFPLKTSIYYSDKNYYIKFYKFHFISKSRTLKKKKTSIKPQKKNKRARSTIFTDKQLILKIFNTISKNKFKPHIRINGYINYSLNNHAITAITYGLLSAILPFIYKGISIIFKIKKFNFPITPIFKEVINIKIQIDGILFVSIGQIIYMSFIILKTIIAEREKCYDE